MKKALIGLASFVCVLGIRADAQQPEEVGAGLNTLALLRPTRVAL